MAEKIRVYQLAKDLNLSSKDLMDILEGLGVSVKSHMSSLEPETSEIVLEYLTGDNSASPKKEEEGKEELEESELVPGIKKKAIIEEVPLEEENGDSYFAPTIQQEKIDKKLKAKNLKKDLEDLIIDKDKKTREDKKSSVSEEIIKESLFEKKILITDPVSVKELADRMELPVNRLIKEFMTINLMVNLNQLISAENASRIAEKFKTEVEVVEAYIEEIYEEDNDENALENRAPVVTIMGHVDHGKTSLLDVIRETNVTATEAGGITQSIGAYQVTIKDQIITFIDTPGHEAFTEMRARGANITDIAVLVVAADDGVMPQTLEAINHARAAKVPIIVAINKMDVLLANPDRVKQQMSEINLLPEEWGGETIMVPVSARKKEGIEELLEMILLQSEMLELKGNPHKKARGHILEAKLDKHKGPVATVIIRNGTLKEGDSFIAGTVYGKVRAMMDYKGNRLEQALPSTPVEIIGLSDVPQAGDELIVCESDKKAKQVAVGRAEKVREQKLRSTHRVTLDELFKQLKEGQIKELNVIIKADSQGSVEALSQALNKLGTEEVKVNIIHGGVGAINEGDIMLAAVSNAIIIGFSVRADTNIMKLAENEKVDIRFYRIIYQVIDDIKSAMAGLLDPIYNEVSIGKAEVRATFNVSKVGVIGGAYVIEGKITRNANVRVIRDGIVKHEGKISSLKRFKDDAREVSSGYECGIGVDKFNGLLPKDIIEAYELQSIKREL